MEQSSMKSHTQSFGHTSSAGSRIANPILVNRQISELRRVMRRMKSAENADVSSLLMAKLAQIDKS